MNYLIVLLVVLAAAAIYYLTRPRTYPSQSGRAKGAPVPQAALDTVPPEPPPVLAGLHPIVRTLNPQLEALLGRFTLVRSAELPEADAQAIGALLNRIPRPPSALHKLVSPQFLAQANTATLSDMVIAEPQVAAKVLVMVNSPLYNLQKPLASISQAVTFLGMNTVRSICLQYLLDESFQSDDPEVKRIFEGLWKASAFASELCFKLAQQLNLPEPGTLVTQVVLSFVGQVASHSLLPKKVVLAMMHKGMLERARIEQEALGLCATEIGSLLMQQWALPETIIERVRAMDLVLLTPCPAQPVPQEAARAFCYLCARLGEKLARGEVQDLAAFELAQEASPEFFHVQSYLQMAALAQLPAALHRPEVVHPINAMVQAMRPQH